ncbi:hypothetical protein FGO68_gene7900 [Halteria grandinella]|uniref:Uncharacterized protein n=1 Tax=Halteria grandinella TaxID=5974 RepID=A0A8J8SZZ6_HALGN|nr:hypothetical protein FGO68_gene7900 [Halteria grandinella]
MQFSQSSSNGLWEMRCDQSHFGFHKEPGWQQGEPGENHEKSNPFHYQPGSFLKSLHISTSTKSLANSTGKLVTQKESVATNSKALPVTLKALATDTEILPATESLRTTESLHATSQSQASTTNTETLAQAQ